MTVFDEGLVFYTITRVKLYAGVGPHKNCGAFVFVLPFCLLFCSKKVKDKAVSDCFPASAGQAVPRNDGLRFFLFRFSAKNAV
jgi:hypothetical protein